MFLSFMVRTSPLRVSSSDCAVGLSCEEAKPDFAEKLLFCTAITKLLEKKSFQSRRRGEQNAAGALVSRSQD